MSAAITSITKSVESPLSAFNNLLNQIAKKFEVIYIGDNSRGNVRSLSFINQMLFDEKSITLFGKIKLIYQNNDFKFKFSGEYNVESLEIIQKTLDNSAELMQLFQQYLFIVSTINKNFDHTVSETYVKTISDAIKEHKATNQLFLVPHKAKIQHCYDSSDKTLDSIFNRYSYLIKFTTTKTHFRYKLLRVLSSELNESKSLDNIRFEDIDVIKEDMLRLDGLDDFLVKLFYYGEIT